MPRSPPEPIHPEQVDRFAGYHIGRDAIDDRASRPNQPNNLTVIKYVSQNSTIRELPMILARSKQQVSEPEQGYGTVQGECCVELNAGAGR